MTDKPAHVKADDKITLPEGQEEFDVTITEEKAVELSRDRGILFKPGRQKLSREKTQAALDAGICKMEK